MNPLKDLLTGGFSSVVSSISDVLGRFVTSPEEKMKAQLELTKLANDYQVQVLLAEKELSVQQASVIVAEAKSESWLARNWRPITMLVFVSIVAFNYVVAPLFQVKLLDLPPDMWQLLKIGIGGYIGARTGEKVVPQVIQAFKK
ncbi:MAG: holin family protein [Gemmatimonadota bacterium]|nr:holin family protein [Gemmatimonadota bacterium]